MTEGGASKGLTSHLDMFRYRVSLFGLSKETIPDAWDGSLWCHPAACYRLRFALDVVWLACAVHVSFEIKQDNSWQCLFFTFPRSIIRAVSFFLPPLLCFPCFLAVNVLSSLLTPSGQKKKKEGLMRSCDNVFVICSKNSSVHVLDMSMKFMQPFFDRSTGTS